MAEITKINKELTQKFDALQEDVNNLKRWLEMEEEKQVFSQISLRVSDLISE